MPKAQPLCGNCNDVLPKTGDYATCSTCGNCLHLDSCSIKRQTWKGLGAVGQSTWVCAVCRNKRKGSSSQTEEENAETDLEVSGIGVQREILAKVNALMDMKSKLDSIENSMKFIAEKYDEVLKEVAELRSENHNLKKEIEVLKKGDSVNRELSENMSAEIADLDQYGRRMNLEIHGLYPEGEISQENLDVTLDKVAKDIGVKYELSEIHQAHRLQPRRDGKPPTVMIQFFSKTTRDIWLQRGKQARLRDVFFNENLCPYFRYLLKESKMRAKTHGFKFVWYRGGRILVRREEADKNILVIKTKGDLRKIG